MQLLLHLTDRDRGPDDQQIEVPVQNERDIRAAGFAAARAVRSWLRAMPFVPATYDLRFDIFAEVVSDGDAKDLVTTDKDAPAPKRKKKAKK